ncbi:hypothetical protein RRG08_046381, partial [Elysia crispata]
IGIDSGLPLSRMLCLIDDLWVSSSTTAQLIVEEGGEVEEVGE